MPVPVMNGLVYCAPEPTDAPDSDRLRNAVDEQRIDDVRDARVGQIERRAAGEIHVGRVGGVAVGDSQRACEHRRIADVGIQAVECENARPRLGQLADAEDRRADVKACLN